jgi:SAM-dependent methyltransferase
MAESSSLRFEHLLIESIVPLTGMGDSLSRGIDMLDIGCGSGRAVNLLAQAFPRSQFYGYDFSEDGVSAARADAQATENKNVHFAVQDLATLHEPDRYKLITAFDVIHDQAKPAEVLQSVADALTADGVFLMMDIRASSSLADNIEYPMAPFIYSLSTMHCMTVSLALDGAGLGTAWGEQKAVAMLEAAGFREIEIHRLEEEPMQNFYVARKSQV